MTTTEPPREGAMRQQDRPKPTTLTGRIQARPSTLLQREILDPQFTYELQYLLRWYIMIEKVQLFDSEHLGLLGREAVVKIATILDQITSETLIADPQANMSDIAFAIEQYIEQRIDVEKPGWHADRSRNDFQACAQLMFGRDQLLDIVEHMFILVQAVYHVAQKYTDVVMPGYTHYQAAQVISPSFYLTALSEHILATLRRLLAVYDDINECPLGGGALAGQQLRWDRQRMANLLGFTAPKHHALIAVASREWVLRIAGELSNFGVVLSRFVTDFIAWSSSEYGFLDLPDDLASISSLMPQKKNFTIFERIRGKTAHISAFYIDFLMGQRNTPYTNLVEVSKEAGSHVISLFDETRSALRLLTATIEHMQFREERMRAICETEYLGGSSIANLLTLQEHLPYRIAQVITGRYIVASIEQQHQPGQADSTLLRSLCQNSGYDIGLSDEALKQACDADQNLHSKQSQGSTHPQEVRELLKLQEEGIADVRSHWDQRRMRVESAYQEIDALITTLKDEWKREHRSGKTV